MLFDCFRDFFECATFGLCGFGVFFEVVCLKGRLLLVPFHVVDSKKPSKKNTCIKHPAERNHAFPRRIFF